MHNIYKRLIMVSRREFFSYLAAFAGPYTLINTFRALTRDREPKSIFPETEDFCKKASVSIRYGGSKGISHGGSGTLCREGNHTYVLTNAHVVRFLPVDIDDNGNRYHHVQNSNGQIVRAKLVTLYQNHCSIIGIQRNSIDLAILEIEKFDGVEGSEDFVVEAAFDLNVVRNFYKKYKQPTEGLGVNVSYPIGLFETDSNDESFNTITDRQVVTRFHYRHSKKFDDFKLSLTEPFAETSGASAGNGSSGSLVVDGLTNIPAALYFYSQLLPNIFDPKTKTSKATPFSEVLLWFDALKEARYMGYDVGVKVQNDEIECGDDFISADTIGLPPEIVHKHFLDLYRYANSAQIPSFVLD